MRSIGLVLGVLLAGCRGDCEPEVKGSAEPEVLGAARRAVDAFFGRLPEGAEVCVSTVKVGRTSAAHGGWYRPLDRRVKISRDAPDWGAELATYNELCHAADLQLDLGSVDHRALWSFDDGYAFGEGFRPGGRRAAREAFAYTCMVGPDGYDWLASIACPEDEGTDEVLAWLADVYGPPTVVPEVVWSPVASVATPEPAVQLQVREDGLLVVDGQWFDLETGAAMAESSPGASAAEVDFRPERPWDAYGVVNTLNHATEWRSATGAWLRRIETGEGIGCYPPDPPVAWRNDPQGRLLVFTWDDGVLTWGRYLPQG